MLGKKVKDKITGFTGVAVAECKYINGCLCYEVRPERLKDGCMLKTEWIDVQQLELVNPKLSVPPDSGDPTIHRRRKLPSGKGASGGPQNRPPQLNTPPEE